MFSKIASSAALVLAAASAVSAQTSTLCNPLKTKCPDDPAFAGSYTCDLRQGLCKDIFANLAGTQAEGYDKDLGAVLTIKGETDSPTFQSHKYMFFGRIDFEMQTAPGPGIVTSVVLQSDDLDEIDIEWVGGDDAQFQTNYFFKGDDTVFDRGAFHPVSTPSKTFHTYSIEWTKDYVKWFLNGVEVRTLLYSTVGAAKFPQTPMQVKFGTWVAGKKGAPDGTIQWAGGLANFAQPSRAYYRSIKIVDTSNGVKGAKFYRYGDQSGTWQSIIVDTEGGDSEDSTTSSSLPSQTSTLVTKTSSKTDSKTESNSQPTGSATTTSTGGNGGPATTSSTPSPTPKGAAPGTALSMGNLAIAGGVLALANIFVL